MNREPVAVIHAADGSKAVFYSWPAGGTVSIDMTGPVATPQDCPGDAATAEAQESAAPLVDLIHGLLWKLGSTREVEHNRAIHGIVAEMQTWSRRLVSIFDITPTDEAFAKSIADMDAAFTSLRATFKAEGLTDSYFEKLADITRSAQAAISDLAARSEPSPASAALQDPDLILPPVVLKRLAEVQLAIWRLSQEIRARPGSDPAPAAADGPR